MQTAIRGAMEGFYVTLPSNVKGVVENTIGNYTTYLPSPIILDSDWKVAITEIFYTNSWYNLKKECVVTINERRLKENEVNSLDPHGVLIEAGRYENIDDIVKQINDYFKDNKEYKAKEEEMTRDIAGHPKYETPELLVNSHTRSLHQKVKPMPSRRFLEFEFEEELGQLIGAYKGSEYVTADVSCWSNFKDVNKAKILLAPKRSYDLTGGHHSLYVYSDIVDFSNVGDTKCQLLRVAEIPSTSKYGDHVHVAFKNPYYLPLANRNISSIEIDIKDDSGQTIDFKFGRVEVVLHFVKQ